MLRLSGFWSPSHRLHPCPWNDLVPSESSLVWALERQGWATPLNRCPLRRCQSHSRHFANTCCDIFDCCDQWTGLFKLLQDLVVLSSWLALPWASLTPLIGPSESLPCLNSSPLECHLASPTGHIILHVWVHPSHQGTKGYSRMPPPA